MSIEVEEGQRTRQNIVEEIVEQRTKAEDECRSNTGWVCGRRAEVRTED